MKRLVMITIAALFTFAMAQANVHAFSLTGYNEGAVNFDYVGADYGTTYTPADPAVDEVFATSNIGDGTSDSWGILNVVSAYQDPINPLWTPSGDTIEIVFGGLDDSFVSWDASTMSFTINSAAANSGAYLKMYYDSSPASTNYAAGPGPSDPMGDGTLWSVGNDPGDQLLLDLAFVPGVISGDGTTVMAATFDADYGHGDGLGYLKVVGGSWASMFTTGMFLGGDADFQFEYSAGDLAGLDYLKDGWTVEVNGIATAAVPVPPSILLLGSGLIGLVGFGRNKFKKV